MASSAQIQLLLLAALAVSSGPVSPRVIGYGSDDDPMSWQNFTAYDMIAIISKALLADERTGIGLWAFEGRTERER